MEKSLLKIAILNDMLHSELVELDPKGIIDRSIKESIMKSRLRNALKSNEFLSKTFDEFFETKELTEMFGNIADSMSDSFNEDFEYFLKHNKIKSEEDNS